jgi:hypothetical protein
MRLIVRAKKLSQLFRSVFCNIQSVSFSFENESIFIVKSELLIDHRCAAIDRKNKRLSARCK